MTTPEYLAGTRYEREGADARIAADYGLRDPQAEKKRFAANLAREQARRAESIDTSTTAGKVAVMQAHDRGERVDVTAKLWPSTSSRQWREVGQQPQWNWEECDYRIAPPEPARGQLALARECRAGMTTADVTSPAGRLCTLVAEIDRSPAVWFGVSLLDQCGIIGAKPGRYRLVRDDSPGGDA
jgi:hypothetical protein